MTALAFLGASVASFRVTSDIDKQTSSLLTNALPSVRALNQARTALRQLHGAVMEAAVAAPPRDERELDAHWKELDAAVARQTVTPWYAGERELYEGQVRPAITDLGLALQSFEKLADATMNDPELGAATTRLRDAARRADSALVSLSDLNHDQAFVAAARIVHNREEAARVSFYLDVGATAAAAIGAILAIRFTRQFAQAMRRAMDLETERANQLDLFAQRVAHDLMSPLAAVSLSLGHVQRKHDDAETSRALGRAQRVLLRSRRMVDGIYAFARSYAAHPGDATSTLRAAVVDAARTLQTVEATDGKDCPVIEVENFDDVEVKIERGLLDIVLSNLLSNASKFTSGAQVRLVRVRACVRGERAHVEVEDTGPGVPDDMVETIFEPYKRALDANQTGLGLGLPTVKRLVLAHAGAVGVRKAPSGGAVFWFELPVATQRASTAEAAARAHLLHPRPSN